MALPLLRPKQVIMLGRPTLHRPVSALLADPQVPVYALTTGPRWPDVSGNSQATGTRAVSPRARPIRRGCGGAPRSTGTRSTAVRSQLAAHPLTTGLHVAAAVADALRPGDQLVLGASNPVRDVALVGLSTDGIKVRSNRGVAGIDGTVSTAIGAALAHERAGSSADPPRTIALIGDLTFVHDSSGLLIGPTEPTPQQLTIVVSNDNGGGIFELLEQGDPGSPTCRRASSAPHTTSTSVRCAGLITWRAGRSRSTELAAALDEPLAACGYWKSRPTARRCGSCMPPSGPRCDAGAGSAETPCCTFLIHGRSDEPPKTPARAVIRWARIVVLIVAGLVTLQSVLLVAGAWRNDLAIQSNMGVAPPRCSAPGRAGPPSSSSHPIGSPIAPNSGCCIHPNYPRACGFTSNTTRTTPDLVRVQHRNAGLAIIPAGSIAVVAGWLPWLRWRAWRCWTSAGRPGAAAHWLPPVHGLLTRRFRVL